MALLSAQLFVHVGRSEGNALIEAYVLADYRRFADHDAGAVVDVEMGADLRAGVDVDSGLAVRVLGHHPRQYRDLQAVGDVGDAVNHDGVESRVAQDNFFDAVRGGIAGAVHFRIPHQSGVNQRYLAEKLLSQFFAVDLLARAKRTNDF